MRQWLRKWLGVPDVEGFKLAQEYHRTYIDNLLKIKDCVLDQKLQALSSAQCALGKKQDNLTDALRTNTASIQGSDQFARDLRDRVSALELRVSSMDEQLSNLGDAVFPQHPAAPAKKGARRAGR